MSIVVIRPDYDAATEITSRWGKEIVGYARERGYDVIDLYGNSASPERFQHAMRQTEIRMIVHYGHGREDALLGQNDIPLLTLGNLELVKGRIFYLVCCHSGKRLSQAILDAGGLAVSAYSGKYIFSPNDETPFRESANAAVEAIIEGKSVREAWQLQRQTYINWIRLMAQHDLSVLKESARAIELCRVTSSVSDAEFWKNLSEAYRLRITAAEIEIQDVVDRRRQQEIGGIILEAFSKIQTAEELYRNIVGGLSVDQKSTASEKLEYAKKYWIIHCRECGHNNPINLPYCKCGAFLYPVHIQSSP